MHTETVTVDRGETDKTGKRTSEGTHNVEAIFGWSSGRANTRFRSRDGRQESFSLMAEMYVRRGADVQARDRIIRSNGEKYVVSGHSLWDQVHPHTGRDFGWMMFQLESANG